MFGKNKLQVQVEQLPESIDMSQHELIEIKDEKVISRIKSAVPELGIIAVNAGAVTQGIQLASEGVYKAILPAGAKLVNSKDMQGAVRGFFRQGKGIGGQANWISVDNEANKIAAANIANVAMGAAALVVGQYYMTQINSELILLNDSISKIADFQMAEYKSRVLTLITQVRRASDFQVEIIEDINLRNEEIQRLQSVEATCMDLLNQANVTIADYCSKEGATFEQYEKMMDEVAVWQKYQLALTDILRMISDLNYTFHLGAMSKEQCYSAYTNLYDTTKKIINKLKRWHEVHQRKFSIDIDQARRARHGLDAYIHKPLELFDEKYKYKDIGKKVAVNIRQQKRAQLNERTPDMRNRYNEDVCLIAQDGKIFYSTK